jgi:hypothetical protein
VTPDGVAPSPASGATHSHADDSAYERVRATFEGMAIPEPKKSRDEGADTVYRVQLKSVQRIEPVGEGAPASPSSGLVLDDQRVQLGDVVKSAPILLRRIDIEEYTFDLATGRVTGVLRFDRRIAPPPAAVAVRTLPPANAAVIAPPQSTVRAETRAVEHALGFEATLTWSDLATDLDAHGFHIRKRDPNVRHVWHAERHAEPYMRHEGASTTDSQRERMLMSDSVKGMSLFVVHDTRAVVDTAPAVLSAVGAEVHLIGRNGRDPMTFRPPNKPGNLWVPFCIVDGRVMPLDVIGTVDGMPTVDDLRRRLPEAFAELDGNDPVVDAGERGWWTGMRARLSIVLVGLLLTALVWSLRGAERGAVMALASVLVAALVMDVRRRGR